MVGPAQGREDLGILGIRGQKPLQHRDGIAGALYMNVGKGKVVGCLDESRIEVEGCLELSDCFFVLPELGMSVAEIVVVGSHLAFPGRGDASAECQCTQERKKAGERRAVHGAIIG
jgi:hypothetical protein